MSLFIFYCLRLSYFKWTLVSCINKIRTIEEKTVVYFKGVHSELAGIEFWNTNETVYDWQH